MISLLRSRKLFSFAVVALVIGLSAGAWNRQVSAQRDDTRGRTKENAIIASPDSPSLLSSGDLDPSFWSGQASVPPGVARVFFGANATERNDSASVIGIQSTGNIILAGNTQGPAFANDFALARFNGTDGSLDTAFGTSGKVLTKFVTGQSDNLIGLAIDKTRLAGDPLLDSIIVVGSTDAPGSCGFSSTNRDFAVARYTASGVLDTTFNTGGLNGTGGQSGKYIKDFHTCNDFANRVVIQPTDHKIVIMGTSFDPAGAGTSYIELVRLMPDGTPDVTFNGSGRIEHNVATYGSSSTINDFVLLNAPAAQAGKFLTLSASTAATSEFEVIRFTSSGAVDATFGTGGKAVVAFAGGGVNDAHSLAIQPSDGKILAAGQTGDAKFCMARWDSGGTLDTASFGAGTGKVIETFPTGTNMGAKFVGVMSNGKIIMSGGGTLNGSSNAVGVARYSSAGVLDASFGTSGRVLTNLPTGTSNNAVNPFAGALQSNDFILIAGTINTSGGVDSDYFVARFINATATAATATVSGRVVISDGRGVTNALVTITDPQGGSRTVITGRRGTFVFENVEVGKTYIVSVGSRRYSYASQVLELDDNVTDLVFTPESGGSRDR